MIQPDEYSEYDWYDFHKSQGHRLIWVTEDELSDLIQRKVPRTLWDRIRPNKTEPPF